MLLLFGKQTEGPLVMEDGECGGAAINREMETEGAPLRGGLKGVFGLDPQRQRGGGRGAGLLQGRAGCFSKGHIFLLLGRVLPMFPGPGLWLPAQKVIPHLREGLLRTQEDRGGCCPLEPSDVARVTGCVLGWGPGGTAGCWPGEGSTCCVL